jgi:hypothetical protein
MPCTQNALCRYCSVPQQSYFWTNGMTNFGECPCLHCADVSVANNAADLCGSNLRGCSCSLSMCLETCHKVTIYMATYKIADCTRYIPYPIKGSCVNAFTLHCIAWLQLLANVTSTALNRQSRTCDVQREALTTDAGHYDAVPCIAALTRPSRICALCACCLQTW